MSGSRIGIIVVSVLAVVSLGAYAMAASDLARQGQVDPSALATRALGMSAATADTAPPPVSPVAPKPATPTPVVPPIAKPETAKSSVPTASSAPHDAGVKVAVAELPRSESKAEAKTAPSSEPSVASDAAAIDAGTPRKRRSRPAESAEASEAPGDDWGTLNLKANAAADVFVDGRRVRKSQLSAFKAKPGNHVVRFDCIGADGTKTPGKDKTVEAVPYAEVDVEWECAGAAE